MPCHLAELEVPILNHLMEPAPLDIEVAYLPQALSFQCILFFRHSPAKAARAAHTYAELPRINVKQP